MTIQGITFYDFIGKLVPGVLIWALIIPIDAESDLSWLWDLAAIVGFFITGITWHRLICWIFPCAKLNGCMLAKAKYRQLLDTHSTDTSHTNKRANAINIRNRYKEAYYSVQSCNLLGNVPVLEAQENFLKSIWPLLPIYLIYTFCAHSSILQQPNLNYIRFGLFIAIISVPFIWYHVQMKIYYLIWEAEYYIKKLNK